MRKSQTLIEKVRCFLKVRTRINKIRRKLFPPRIDVDGLIPEIRSISTVKSDFVQLRINLVIYSISASDRFGGIQSSIDFAEALFEHIPCLRILVTDVEPSAEDIAGFADFNLVASSDDSSDPRQIQFIGPGPDRTFYVGKNDIFITHGWWEAYRAEHWTAWQSETYSCPRRPVIFMIQEFEPGFFAFSSCYALAEQVFKTKHPHIAVINTALLSEYYRSHGYQFQNAFSFEPQMNARLRDKLEKLKYTKKEKILFCYCRKSAERNAFELVALALREWAAKYPEAKDWRVISAGAPHDPFEIAPGRLVRSMGKLTLDDYALLLSRSAVGLSLMISPHPSYPPLEFAHYGLRVLTNGFTEKDLSRWHDNIRSVDDLRPDSIANELISLCVEAVYDLDKGWNAASRIPQYLSTDNTFFFSKQIATIIENTIL